MFKYKKILAVLVSAAICLQPAVSLTAYAAEESEGAYIEIPAEYRSWDENGKDQDFDHSGTAENGMVAALRYEPAVIGTEIMKKGGTAIDAAVATAFALTVTMPQMCGIAGGGLLTFYNAETGETVYLSFREVAPKFQTADMWVTDEGGAVIGNHNMVGGLSAGVPGEVAGLWKILEDYGTMEWADVIQPAIDLARGGFTVTPELAESILNGYEYIHEDEEAASIYLTEDGLVPEAGTIIKNEPLARTYEKLRDGGREVFYEGQIGKDIVKAAQQYGGVMTMQDLADYEAWYEEPASGTYRGYTIYSSASPSSGGTFIIETLNILENLPVQEFGTTEYFHQLNEVQKMVWADRGEYMGDTRFIEVPLKGIMDKEYAADLAKHGDMTKAHDFTFGDPKVYMTESQNTTNFVVADKAGNMVALTHTINSVWGSQIYVKGGYFLNNQLGDFVVGNGYANSLEPGKAPLSSMSPTVVLDPEGKPFMTLGAPGGFMIFQSVAQVILNAIDYGMDIDKAQNSKRIAAYGSTLMYGLDDFTDEEEIQKLVDLGHESTRAYKEIGWPAGIMFLEDGTMAGSAEATGSLGKFSDGCAVGF